MLPTAAPFIQLAILAASILAISAELSLYAFPIGFSNTPKSLVPFNSFTVSRGKYLAWYFVSSGGRTALNTSSTASCINGSDLKLEYRFSTSPPLPSNIAFTRLYISISALLKRYMLCFGSPTTKSEPGEGIIFFQLTSLVLLPVRKSIISACMGSVS